LKFVNGDEKVFTERCHLLKKPKLDAALRLLPSDLQCAGVEKWEMRGIVIQSGGLGGRIGQL